VRGTAFVAAGVVLFGSGFLGACDGPRGTRSPTVIPETNVLDGTTFPTRCRTITASDGRFDTTCGTTLTHKQRRARLAR
jgi:hypothetical protein